MADEEFEPRIIGFCCNWCSYAGADLAGVSRLQYPPNLRVIRGGWAGSPATQCCSAYRDYEKKKEKHPKIGFRLVADPNR